MQLKSFNLIFLLAILLLLDCEQRIEKPEIPSGQFITILGIAQDAGYPQVDCKKECCVPFYNGIEKKKRVTSLGLVDKTSNEKWLFDATPDITSQLDDLNRNHLDNKPIINGIFLTHAHIGHYTGLMYLGREVLGAKEISVYAMPRMKDFLETNGPWSQLVSLRNIALKELQAETTVKLNARLKVTPFLVPHRDEYSETVGYKIDGPTKSALFIPDINKWSLWGRDIVDEVKKVDYAFLDATFFKNGEIARPMDEVPHPFITETTKLFEKENLETKAKVVFIHFNHSNPANLNSHKLKDSIIDLGFRFSAEGLNF
ncbi:MAG: pyrroloquinoline quinone biosynthesis protein PqqB, partial [Flavobacteriaceae bacterium]